MWRVHPHGAAALLLAASLAGCGSGQPGPGGGGAGTATAAQAPREVRVVSPTARLLPRVVPVTGTLAADEEIVLAFKVDGRVASVSVDLGSPVRQGAPLARIDATDFSLRVSQAEAALTQARARLGLSPGGGDDAVDPEGTPLVRQGRATLNEARLTRDRTAALWDQRLVSRAQLDAAEAALQVAEGRYQDAREEVRSRQALLVQRRSEVAIARQQLRDTTLVAPSDGVVQERRVSAGQYVKAGDPVATVVRVHPLRLRLAVPERAAAAVRAGQPVRVTVEGDPRVYEGRVARLAPAIQQDTRTLLVEAEIPNERRALRAGAFARGEIVTVAEEPAVLVPVSAVVTFAGIEKVLIVRDGRAVETRVRTGRRDGDLVELVEGLPPGAAVIVEPGSLVTGHPVTVREAPSAAR